MSRRLVNMRLPVDLLERVDSRAKELGQTRTMFVERALEAALGVGPVGRRPQPASSSAAKSGVRPIPRKM